MSAPAAPKDNSVELANIEAQRAREERERLATQEQQQRQRFEGSLNSSYSSAIDDARNYFLQRGLNPDDYSSVIQRAATSARNKVPDMASAPGTYFDNLGATAFDQEQGGKRAQYLRDINGFAGDGFATKRITSDADDATLEAILQEQRQTADGYIKNLLERGVITGGGYDAATRDLENQTYGAKSRLNELGNIELEKGRSKANEIANRGKTSASNYTLGQTFDPYAISTELDSAFGDFFANLGGNLRSAIPANLFSTSGLAGVAGAGMGAQNTKFDPAALAGVFADPANDDEEERSLLSAF